MEASHEEEEDQEKEEEADLLEEAKEAELERTWALTLTLIGGSEGG